MSIEAVNDFAVAMRHDDGMARGLAAAVEDKADGEAAEAFVAYARQHGFEVTVEDLEGIRRSAAQQRELSDEELDAVSGAGIFDLVGQVAAHQWQLVAGVGSAWGQGLAGKRPSEGFADGVKWAGGNPKEW